MGNAECGNVETRFIASCYSHHLTAVDRIRDAEWGLRDRVSTFQFPNFSMPSMRS